MTKKKYVNILMQKTKFKPGDKAWFVYDGELHHETIARTFVNYIQELKDRVIVEKKDVFYYIETQWTIEYRDRHLFKTKQELKNHLFQTA